MVVLEQRSNNRNYLKAESNLPLYEINSSNQNSRKIGNISLDVTRLVN